MQSPAIRFAGHVLLVEDNPINRLIASELLDRLGVRFECAENGAEALERLAADTFDLVLMDCLMPRLDGFAATHQWRERERIDGRPRTPIVAVSANVTEDDRDRCLACGMDEFLPKPIHLTVLAAVLARYLRAA
jgi:CheY-like chemotaxis protein